MNRTDQIHEMVAKGEVLDERWNWIPILRQLEKEKEFIQYVESGHVLCEGKWVTISEALEFQAEAARRKKEAQGHLDEVQLSMRPEKYLTPEGEEIPPPPETVLIADEPLENIQPKSVPGLTANKGNLNLSGFDIDKKKQKRKYLLLILGVLLTVSAAAAAVFFLFIDLFHQW